VRLQPETIARRLSETLKGNGLRWAHLQASPVGGIEADIVGEGGAIVARVRAQSRFQPPCALVARSHPVDGLLCLEAPVEAHQKAVALALRAGAMRRELEVRQAAVAKVRLPHRALGPLAPARVIYHGRPTAALLPLTRALGEGDVLLHAALTPMSALDAVHEGGADGLALDAVPGKSRVLSILNALRRNARSAGLPTFVLSKDTDPELLLEAVERGARGVWSHAEARLPAFAGWLAEAVMRTRAQRAASAQLDAIADAGTLASPSALAYRAAYLDLALKVHRHMRLIGFVCRAGPDVRLRGNDAVGLARRILRSADTVFWRDPDCLVIGLPNTQEGAAKLVAARVRAMLPNAAFSVLGQAQTVSRLGESGEGLLRRLDADRTRTGAHL
jgi:hypothetical protein